MRKCASIHAIEAIMDDELKRVTSIVGKPYKPYEYSLFLLYYHKHIIDKR
jgi:hypothetical protein